MKGLRQFFVIVAIASCLALAALGTAVLIKDKPETGKIGGERSRALREEYKTIKAKEVNKSGVKLFIDDKVTRISGLSAVSMSDNMEVLVSADCINDIFKCNVRWKDGYLLLSRPSSSMSSETEASEERRVALLNEEGKKYSVISDGSAGDHLSVNAYKNAYASVKDIAPLLGYSYIWSSEKNSLYIYSPKEDRLSLPARYDLREKGKTSAIRDQGNWGSCWAFAAVSALESILLPGQDWDFSEDNMVNNNGFSVDGVGGDFNMALAYLLSWRGPVREDEDEYGDEESPQGLKPAVHLQEAVIINDRDYEQIKALVYKYGAVQISIYSPQNADALELYYNEENAAFYCPGSKECNHDIDIIGWDDEYPAENFNETPSKDGAFICKNSWGEGFGENGYFYISYDDPNIGIYGAAYTGVESADNYDNIYQSDILGWTGSIGYEAPSAKFAAVYTAGGDETIRAAGFYSTGRNTWYDVYIVEDFMSVSSLSGARPVCSGFCADKGFVTAEFADGFDVRSGEKFAVVVDIYTENSLHPIAIEYPENILSRYADLSDGENYMSSDLIDWSRMEEKSSCNACLKVYTDSDN